MGGRPPFAVLAGAGRGHHRASDGGRGSEAKLVALTRHAEESARQERRQAALLRRGLWLEWTTNGWNALEVLVTISLGIRAGSLALIAFGLDSVIEIFASTVVIRHLRDRRLDPGDRRVHQSLRLIALAFWILAAFLVVMSVRGLVRGDRPDDSPVAVAYLAVTACVMFGLATVKRVTARQLRSEPLHAEAAMTFLDGCLSTGILAALVLNASLGWWWADATAAVLVAGFAVSEGGRHWRESAPHEEQRAEPRARESRV